MSGEAVAAAPATSVPSDTALLPGEAAAATGLLGAASAPATQPIAPDGPGLVMVTGLVLKPA